MSAVNTWGVAPNVWASDSNSLNVTMDDFNLSSIGQVGIDVTGSIAIAMDSLSMAANGSATNDAIGTINLTMNDFTMSAIGTLDNPAVGTINVTMDDFTLITPSFSGGNRFISAISSTPIRATAINVIPIKIITK